MDRNYRDFLKDTVRKKTDFSKTAQSRGIAPPPVEKPSPPGAKKIELISPGKWQNIRNISIEKAIALRKSHRSFTKDSMKLDEISFLLWATQGVRKKESERICFRTVPSAGCRHAFETYLAVFRVDNLEKAIYRYLPLSHELLFVRNPENLEKEVAISTLGQNFCSEGAAVFYWTALPERMEWRYSSASYKVIALDAGHVCQNLYLACSAINAGTCAIAAYDQERADEMLDLNGLDEFVIYIAPVGKIEPTLL
ncbi:SagB/ThcOx family dehydrogenase [candidate division WOR-3 bacterium]|nr:SagB/ThcOx family dehydrogenase [candidate division WOR-3 bacterium]